MKNVSIVEGNAIMLKIFAAPFATKLKENQ